MSRTEIGELMDKDYIVSISQPISKFCGVYFLIDGSEIVYVGQSVNIGARIATHQSNPLKKFDSYSFLTCEKEQLDDLESLYIRKFSPKLNKVLPNSPNLFTAKRISFGWGVPLWKIQDRLDELEPVVVIGNRKYYDKSVVDLFDLSEIDEWRLLQYNIRKKKIKESVYSSRWKDQQYKYAEINYIDSVANKKGFMGGNK